MDDYSLQCRVAIRNLAINVYVMSMSVLVLLLVLH